MGVKHLIDPAAGAGSIPKGSTIWNTNKWWEVAHVPGTITMRGRYNTDPHTGEKRTGTDDALAGLYWIPGITATYPSHWPGQKEVSETRITVAPVNIGPFVKTWTNSDVLVRRPSVGRAKFLADQMPNVDEGDEIIINGLPYGVIVRYTPNGHSVWAVKMTKTLTSRCMRTNVELPLLEEGQILQLDEANALGAIVMELTYEHKKKTVFDWVASVARAGITALVTLGALFGNMITKRVERQVSVHAMAAEATAEAQQQKLEKEYIRGSLGNTIPQHDEQWSRDVVSGNFTRRYQFAAVVFVDIVGYSKIEARLREKLKWREDGTLNEDYKIQAADMLNEVTDKLLTFASGVYCDSFGGLSPKNLGDGSMYYFTTGHSGDNRDPSDPTVQADLVERAIEASLALLRNGARLVDPNNEFDLQLRIGLHCGDITIRLTERKLDIFGMEVNIAARYETISKPNRLCISWEAMQVLERHPMEGARFSGLLGILLAERAARKNRLAVISANLAEKDTNLDILKDGLPVGEIVVLGRWSFEYQGMQTVKHYERLFGWLVSD